MRRAGLIGLLASGLVIGAQAAPVVSDLAPRNVDIRYSFAGTELLLFGALERNSGLADDAEFDVIAVVSGPQRRAVVRRKERVAGIWVNRDALIYETAPGYYFVAATAPLDEITDDHTRRIHQIGIDVLALSASGDDDMSAAKQQAFRAGLIRHRISAGLYNGDVAAIERVGGSLFRSAVPLPAGVPVGPYRADIYLFSQGKLMGRSSVALGVDKSGFERFVYDLAQTRPATYGIMAIIIALTAGWLAGVIFRQH